METILYKKTQFNILIWVISVPVCVVLVFLSLKANDLSLSIFNLVFLGFLIVVNLIFSRLTITLTNKKIEATFGLRIFKQQMDLESIKPENIEVFKPSSWYGIGLRLTPKGKLFNVKFGKAIRIETPDKTFFVGSDEAEHIKDLMIKELRKSDLS
ncbi:hypothetical protein [Mesonia sp. K7]|uniref:hypothetical protein n=1 Tax=Mesonia sp. K7 TaxID=2218606 RepID=UPI000DA96D28|nr:hypothetical protein [Mesonia sp. K7]PZD77254.1 hypothetical protein DNG35_09280 [Mesonia sp. K7]